MLQIKYFTLLCLLCVGIAFGASRRDSLIVHTVEGGDNPVGVWWGPSDAPVAVWFHGGMNSGNCTKGFVAGDDLAGLLPNYTVVSTSACKWGNWLTPTAMQWVDAALDSVAARRKMPVDTVYLIGVSDGALGVANYSAEGKRKVFARTVISSFIGMLGEASAFASVPGLRSGKWLFIQGGSDRLYPAQETVPWIESFCKKVGVSCELEFDQKGEHDWSYWKNNHLDWVLRLFKEK